MVRERGKYTFTLAITRQWHQAKTNLTSKKLANKYGHTLQEVSQHTLVWGSYEKFWPSYCNKRIVFCINDKLSNIPINYTDLHITSSCDATRVDNEPGLFANNSGSDQSNLG